MLSNLVLLKHAFIAQVRCLFRVTIIDFKDLRNQLGNADDLKQELSGIFFIFDGVNDL